MDHLQPFLQSAQNLAHQMSAQSNDPFNPYSVGENDLTPFNMSLDKIIGVAAGGGAAGLLLTGLFLWYCCKNWCCKTEDQAYLLAEREQSPVQEVTVVFPRTGGDKASTISEEYIATGNGNGGDDLSVGSNSNEPVVLTVSSAPSTPSRQRATGVANQSREG